MASSECETSSITKYLFLSEIPARDMPVPVQAAISGSMPKTGHRGSIALDSERPPVKSAERGNAGRNEERRRERRIEDANGKYVKGGVTGMNVRNSHNEYRDLQVQ
ncbi:hypothetical protein PRIPAC_85802 [Pristionchus pacificus]|uniref:Uncharacterized protein n=1 Tax=Pristionchus pacificus TaxID=54126 RepID=A0A2A6BU85_PRIPA|nr:hypothetical protein PRIPAC_85802 [Pristionchus pacificus]|eukprot:PDM69427.1 hypothetical protein PRIPAC_44523 [Pristionchus pacificus]